MKLVLLVTLCMFLSACTKHHSLLMSQNIKNTTDINIIFFGNSITYHPPTKDWVGNFGMAASSADTDYVHIVSDRLNANFITINLADWERGYWYYDYKKIDPYKGWADIAIIKLGENVSDIIDFKKSFQTLLEHIDCKNTIVVSIWPNNPTYPQVNEYMRSVAMANNFQWVELPERDATYNASNDKNSFIATHPGDKGMRLIADSILTAIQKTK